MLNASQTILSPAQKTALLGQIVAVARTQVGVEEQPRFSNDGPIVRIYQRFVGIGRDAWCLAFGEYCVGQACHLLGIDFDQTTLIRTGYCPAAADHARANGTAVSAADVASGKVALRAGWLVLVWETNPLGYHHCEVVEEVGDGGAFTTIGGNTVPEGFHAPPGAEREGYCVARHHRNVHELAADGHARYCFIMVV